jgi:hypothetical protein
VISLALEGVLALQKTAQGGWWLAADQLNVSWQGDHLKGLAGAEAELLTVGQHPLGQEGGTAIGAKGRRRLRVAHTRCGVVPASVLERSAHRGHWARLAGRATATAIAFEP